MFRDLRSVSALSRVEVEELQICIDCQRLPENYRLSLVVDLLGSCEESRVSTTSICHFRLSSNNYPMLLVPNGKLTNVLPQSPHPPALDYKFENSKSILSLQQTSNSIPDHHIPG